jgi:hypothetical protein
MRAATNSLAPYGRVAVGKAFSIVPASSRVAGGRRCQLSGRVGFGFASLEMHGKRGELRGGRDSVVGGWADGG